MGRFVEGVDRFQLSLLPECLEDWVGESNAVHVIEAFVETLNLSALGFTSAIAKETGRPAYHSTVLLKLYIYGYLNRVQSSRRLEREAGRNVELMWLLGRLVPDHKTIADFRKDNGLALRKVCAQFVALCRTVGLLNGDAVVIDGSKFKAVNNRDRNFTQAKMARRLAQIEASIARYLSQLDSADRQEPSEAMSAKIDHLKEKIAGLRQEMLRLAALDSRMKAAPDQQISLTDPDARLAGYDPATANLDSELLREENLQEQFFYRLAGEYMGAGPKRGRTYTWLYDHLADTFGETSPRSFITALQRAAQHSPAPSATVIDYNGIRAGVQDASRVRVSQLKEDYDWIYKVMGALDGLEVPCDPSTFKRRWTERSTVRDLRSAAQGQTSRLPLELVAGHDRPEDALLRALANIGVVEFRTENRINMPDIFRVEARIKRRGGVRPPSARR